MMHRPPDTTARLTPCPDGDDTTLRDLFDPLLLGFQVIAFDWTYVYVNPAAARQGRKTPRELVGRTMEDAYPGIGGTELFRRLDECMRTRQEATFENAFTFPDGSQQWFEIRVQPVPEGICVYSQRIEGPGQQEHGGAGHAVPDHRHERL